MELQLLTATQHTYVHTYIHTSYIQSVVMLHMWLWDPCPVVVARLTSVIFDAASKYLLYLGHPAYVPMQWSESMACCFRSIVN